MSCSEEKDPAGEGGGVGKDEIPSIDEEREGEEEEEEDPLRLVPSTMPIGVSTAIWSPISITVAEDMEVEGEGKGVGDGLKEGEEEKEVEEDGMTETVAEIRESDPKVGEGEAVREGEGGEEAETEAGGREREEGEGAKEGFGVDSTS